jgi:signal transduction histidine kinase
MNLFRPKRSTLLRTSFFSAAFCVGASLLPAAEWGLRSEAPENGLKSQTIREIQMEAASETFQEKPVRTQGVVTWVDETAGRQFYIQDDTGGIQITFEGSGWPKLGDVLETQGMLTFGSFAPIISRATFENRGTAPLPTPKRASVGGLLHGAFNGEYVSVDGWVRSAERVTPGTLAIVLNSGSARITLRISNVAKNFNAKRLIASQVYAYGVASPVKARGAIHQLVDLQVLVAQQSNLFVNKPETVNPWKQPITPLKRAFQYHPGHIRGERIHVQGKVILIKDNFAYLNDGESGLTVRGSGITALTRGSWVEAVGFLDLENYLPILSDAELAPGHPAKTPIATPMSVSDLQDGLQHANYVSVVGQLLDRMEIPGTASGNPQKTRSKILALTLQSPHGAWTAELESGSSDPLLPHVEVGSTLRISGICLVQTDTVGNPSTFKILIPAADQIAIVKPASFFTVKRLLILLSLSLAIILAAVSTAYLFARRNVGLLATMRERQAIEAERTRLARDLHDTLEQGLTGIHLHLHSIGSSPDEASPETQERLGIVRTLVGQCHMEIRKCIWNLRSTALDHFDLGEALERSARSLVLGSDIQIQLRQERGQVRIPPLIEDNLLRIGQEAVTNAVKHAHASELRIDLVVKPTHVSLVIHDNGVGITEPQERNGHFGLVGMQERAARIGGRLNIASSPNGGCTVRVDVPLNTPTSSQP